MLLAVNGFLFETRHRFSDGGCFKGIFVNFNDVLRVCSKLMQREFCKYEFLFVSTKVMKSALVISLFLDIVYSRLQCFMYVHNFAVHN